jgi:type II secretory pathway pseudopilin PulG
MLALVLVGSAFALSACGGSSDDGAAEVARQQELRVARAQAAQDARQSGRIADLERKLHNANKAGSEPRTTQAPPVSGSVPAEEQELPTKNS